MQLSLSVRVVEAPSKTKLNVPFRDFVQMAAEVGYTAVCMRASAAGVNSSPSQLEHCRHELDKAKLRVSMVTAESDVPINNDRGPDSLRNIEPSLQVAEALGGDLIRVCLKNESDIDHARRAADIAGERGIRLAHQCHTTTLFEQVECSLDVLRRIDRANFGLIYEPANLMLCGEEYGAPALRKFQPYLMNVYVQNHVLDPAGPVELETWCRGIRRFRHLPLWEAGGVDFSKVVSGLSEVGYQGTFTIHHAQNSETLAAAREYASQCKRWFDVTF